MGIEETIHVTIGPFQGEHAFLSNFYPSPIEVEGQLYPTVEHAFQAQKTFDPYERRRIAHLWRPSDAKRAGRQLRNIRPDWDEVKLEIMEALVELKFRESAVLCRHLFATGNAELREENHWGDTFYGVVNGRGENHLGKILMRVREKLRSEFEVFEQDAPPWEG